MAHFYPLEVINIEKNTPDAAIIALRVPKEHQDKFSFQSGQYLTFRHMFEDEELRRSYSICKSEHSGALQIGVKAVEGGIFSKFANYELVAGDRLEVMPPQGNFILGDIAPGAHILMIAAGSGITPIISHIETLFERDSNVKITLIYGNKTPHSTMFRERLEELKSMNMERFSVIHVLSSSPQDITLFSGRITNERCQAIVKKWVSEDDINGAYICGPNDMIENVRTALEEIGLSKAKIKYELFATSWRKNGAAVKKTKLEKDVALTVILDGAAHQFPMSKDEMVLEVARENNLDAPFSCRSGICSTCRCKILEGEAGMDVNHVLEDYEIEAGYALSCQLSPRSKKLTISYDEGH